MKPPPCPPEYGDIERAEYEAQLSHIPPTTPFPFCPLPVSPT